jgi:signal peptidase I
MNVKFEQRSASACELVAEVARRFGEVQLRVTGASMLPAIWPGDILCVRRCSVFDLQPGRILLYRRHGKLIAHRIVSIQGDIVTTQGDSIGHNDTPITESDFVGQVISVVRRGRCVPDQPSFIRRIGSGILRRSDLSIRATMLMARRAQRSVNEEILWA